MKEKIFYHIYPLGFCGAKEKNDGFYNGEEKLLKILDWIPHMKYLGVNALYLGPVFESSEHGYDTKDYFQVDKRLGTNETLKHLINVLHENDIIVVLDGVFNHVGREHFAFKDLKEKRENSQYKNWFNGLNFNGNNPYNDHFHYNTWAGHYSLVKVNLKDHGLKNHLFDAARYWINEFNIDGIRLDAADSLDFEFMDELSKLTKTLNSKFWLMGEVVHGDYRQWLQGGNLDATTNYECFKGIYSSHNDKNYFEIAYSLKRLFGENGIYKNYKLYNFVDNHDVNRVASLLKRREDLYNVYTLLFAIPGIPSIYYGSEWEIKGEKTNGSDRNLRPNLDINEMNSNGKNDLLKHISNLSKIRKELNSLKDGSYRELVVNMQQIVFERANSYEKVIVILNSSSDENDVQIKDVDSGRYIDILNDSEEFYLENGSKIKVHSNWGRILKKI